MLIVGDGKLDKYQRIIGGDLEYIFTHNPREKLVHRLMLFTAVVADIQAFENVIRDDGAERWQD